MSELFTELSDQQQELVAGGAVTLANLNSTSFYSNTELLGAGGAAFSNPNGAASAGQVSGANQEIFTNAFSFQLGKVD